MAVDYLLQFVLLFLYTTQLLLVKFLKLGKVAFGYLMILFFALLVIDACLHGGPFNFSPHLFHPGLQSCQFVFQFSNLLQLLVPFLFQLLYQLQFFTRTQIRFFCFIQLGLQSGDFSIFIFSQSVKRLLQLFLFLSDVDNLAGQSFQLIICS